MLLTYNQRKPVEYLIVLPLTMLLYVIGWAWVINYVTRIETRRRQRRATFISRRLREF